LRQSAVLAPLATLALALLAPAAAPAAWPSPWSAPARLGSCASSGAARAVFPHSAPSEASGSGAIVWSAARSCPQGAGTLVSRLGSGDLPSQPSYARAPSGRRLSLRAPLAIAPAPHGQIAIAGSGDADGAAGTLVQGTASGPFSLLGSIDGLAQAGTLATGYLGDLAAVSPPASSAGTVGLSLSVERFFAHTLSPTVKLAPAAHGAIEAPTVSLDYRSDAILAWAQGGALYASEKPASGRALGAQRLAGVGRSPHVSALISDDHRAIVAWAQERAGVSSVYVDQSADGVRFDSPPQLLERFVDPGGVRYPSRSPLLVRLSSESVMLAWSGAAGGHWVVRAAAIDQNGVGAPSTISSPQGDALLSDLQPGPDGEAIALWSEPQRVTNGTLDLSDQAIVAARGYDSYPTQTIFSAPEQIAPPGPGEEATLAIDPASDRALALWRGAAGVIEYSIREAAGR
jgi:hypothetical protein